MTVLAAGTTAPDFTLQVAPDQKLSLSELRGKPVILAFYPADWSPVCGDQMALYNEVLPDFQSYGGGVDWYFSRRSLVPRSLRQGPQSPFSTGRGL